MSPDLAQPGLPPPDDVLLEVRGLKTYFKVMDGTVSGMLEGYLDRLTRR